MLGPIGTFGTPGVTGASFVPTGAVLPFFGTKAPSGYLFCDGSSVSRGAYPALFSVMGTSCGTTNNGTFNIPDLRGFFLRGADSMGTAAGATGRDPNAASRGPLNAGGNTGNNLGSAQTDATDINGLGIADPTHTHLYTNPSAPTNIAYLAGASPTTLSAVATVTPNSPVSSSVTGVTISSADAETRPLNVYCFYIIKT